MNKQKLSTQQNLERLAYKVQIFYKQLLTDSAQEYLVIKNVLEKNEIQVHQNHILHNMFLPIYVPRYKTAIYLKEDFFQELANPVWQAQLEILLEFGITSSVIEKKDLTLLDSQSIDELQLMRELNILKAL